MLDPGFNRCVGTFHLVENNSVIEGLAVLNLVVPSFLAENAVLMIDRRTEYCIEIYSRQIDEVLLVLR